MLCTVEESHGYDFQDPENAEKWKGMFMNPLRKVLEQVHPALTAEESALAYVESLCLRLLGMLCAIPSPLTMQDVEERVAKTFPTPIDKWALNDARDTVDRTKKKKSILPTDRVHQMLQKEVLLYKIDSSVSIFIVAILEYISADILKLAGNYVKKISQKSGYFKITYQDIKTAMCADKVLMDMFYQDEEPPSISGGADGVTTAASSAQPTRTPSASRAARRGSLTYAELVRDLLADERQFLRELHLIIRVFKEEVERIVDRESRAVRLIFANIVDIYELTVTLLGNLEDAVEMSQDSPTPYIGSCFEELAEVEEFRAYVRYANIVTKQESRDALQNIVDDPELSEQLATAGHGFRLAVKYYLPKLLMAPIAHIFLYHNYVLALLQIAPTPEDRESFKQVECNLHPIKKLLIKALGNGPKMEAALRMATRARRQLAIEKTHELSRLIDNWDQKDIGQCCNEFIREDTLSKLGPGKRIAERRAYLFDGLLLLCKPVTSLVTVGGVVASGSAGGSQLKLKEKLHIRKLDVIDRNDTDEMKHCVELAPRVGGSVLLACGSCPEKKNWMSDLVMLNTKSMLDRTLDSILLDLERKHPLKLPSPEIYRFAVPDSPENIVLEERQNSGVPLIKGATLLKLVERLTYHIYADLAFMRTFLTTYRSFCAPAELLDLLIERFNIPDPSLVYDTPEKMDGVVITDMEKLSKNTAREDWKRYRKEFSQPVRFRVINVLRHWVDQHFYDFERDAALLERLRAFLESVDGKPMRKWVQSVLKTVQRKTQPPSETENSTTGVAHVFDRAPPPLQRHVEDDPERYGWHPLALHPLELARQLTLLEFDLYRTVKPSELVGAVWTKKDKEKTSPNLLRIIKHTTNFTRWMEKCVVEAENVEERVGVVSRLLETMLALRELNNFNGVLAVVAAMRSASVFRLKYTYQMISARLERALEECSELNSDHFRRYQERLRSINPPCVPFCGMYLTMILHIEDGNKDFLPNSELINFAKRRKVAEITGEIQQYQNQPYCLTVDPKTRAFLENLNPFPGMDDTEIRDYLYNKSLEIEPRPPVKQLPKFPRKWPELSLKSPGIKPSRRHHTHNNQHADNTDDNISVSQLSPTSVCGASSVGGWDAASLGSTQTLASTVHGDSESQSSGAVGAEDHHTSSRAERPMLVSPRLLERTGANTFSLFDRGFGFFDKSTSRLASTMSLNRHSSNVTSPSGLTTRDGESVSPRLPSHSITELSSRMLENFTSAAPPVSPRPFSTLGHPRVTSHHHHDHDAPGDLTWEAKHQRIVNDIIGNCGSGSGGHGFCMSSTGGHGTANISRPPALSPRNPIVDACCFYGTNSAVVHHSFGDLMMGCGSVAGVKKNVSPRGAAPELTELRTSKPPALSPRGRLDVDRSTKPAPVEEPPAVLPRARPATPPPPPETVASTVVPEHSSPKVTAGDNGVVVGAGCVVPRMPISPKRSPAPNPPPLSPHVNVPNSVQNYERHHGIPAGAAFSFPSSNTKTNVSPAIPTSPTVISHALLGAPHTPPPLPPRRRRDSVTTPGHNQWGPVPPPRAPSPPRSPPPLPPRPPAQLLRPAHSTILQRRQHTGAACGTSGTLGRSRDDSSGPLPRLPPKPPKP